MTAPVLDCGGPPSLAALCLARLARGAPQRVLLTILRRLPEELVLSLLAQMMASKTITDDRLAAFFMIARRVLNLSGCCAIRNSVLRQIPFRCPELRCLDLSNCAQVTNSVVRAVLQGCSNLQTLRLDGCRHITDAAFQPDHSPFYPLRACTSLQVVSFARCSQLTKDLVLFLVKACRSLTDINFSRCKRIDDDAIHMLLRSATALERLNLSFMDAISDAAFTTEPSDQRNGFYGMGRALRRLDLTQAAVTDVALSALARHCRQLESVKLGSCGDVTDAGVEALVSSCASLRELDLTNCALVTDRGARALGAFGRRLERLDLSWCLNLTDKAVVDLARGCDRLQEVRFVWCTQLTDAAIDAFVAALRLQGGDDELGGNEYDDGDAKARRSERRLQLCLTGCKGVSREKMEEARQRGLEIVADA